MSADKITLKQIQLRDTIDGTLFLGAYEKLINYKHDLLTDEEKFSLLRFAVIFLNHGEHALEKFGYRIILRYSNAFNDYQPLYDIAINKNYIPVAKFIEQKHFKLNDEESNFHNLLMSAYKENFKKGNLYLSQGQKELDKFSTINNDYIVVAPTSYGKSEIIIARVENNLSKKICIVVPSKALLSQTRKRLIRNEKIRNESKKIITHPDMFNGTDDSYIAVLTQERLLRLLQKNDGSFFDFVFVDEAHNILSNESRSILLMQDLLVLKKRNPATIFNFFTPFLANPEELKILSENTSIEAKKLNEFIKVERYYIFDLNSGSLNLYDQFLNKFFPVTEYNLHSDIDFININKSKKNIIYLNRPRDIEKFSLSINNEKPIQITEDIEVAQKALSEFLHKDYNLLNSIKNGVVYHHGGMPDIVRMYVEDIFSKDNSIEFIVTSSTLLEGVNIPAEKIFLLTTKIGNRNFNPSELKNIIGRVCRFSEVFNSENGNLNLLEPEIYIVKGEYSAQNANVENFIEKGVKENKIIEDSVENILIKKNNSDIELTYDERVHLKEELECLENIEPGTTNVTEIRYVKSEIAKSCYKNNVHDFDIFLNEEILIKNEASNRNLSNIDNANNLISAIVKIFLDNIEKVDTKKHNNFERLKNEPAQKFYSMFLDWRASGTSYNEMIRSFIYYWDNLSDKVIYFGKRWGEIKRNENYTLPLHVDLSKKTASQKVNLAILRIKEEQDFVEYELMKYVEVLNDLEFLNNEFYEKIKYGSNNPKVIQLLKDGFSVELAKRLIIDTYNDYIDFTNDGTEIKNSIVDKMKKEKENEILIFEIKYHINVS